MRLNYVIVDDSRRLRLAFEMTLVQTVRWRQLYSIHWACSDFFLPTPRRHLRMSPAFTIFSCQIAGRITGAVVWLFAATKWLIDLTTKAASVDLLRCTYA